MYYKIIFHYRVCLKRRGGIAIAIVVVLFMLPLEATKEPSLLIAPLMLSEDA